MTNVDFSVMVTHTKGLVILGKMWTVMLKSKTPCWLRSSKQLSCTCGSVSISIMKWRFHHQAFSGINVILKKAWEHYEPSHDYINWLVKGEKFQVGIYMNILSSSCSAREVTLSSLTSADCLCFFFPRRTHIQAHLCYQLSNCTPCGFSSAWKCWC